MIFTKILLALSFISFVVFNMNGDCTPSSYLFDLNEYKHYNTIIKGKIIAHRIDTIYEPQIPELSFEEEYYLMDVSTVFKGKAAKRIKLKAFMKFPKLFTDVTYILYLDAPTNTLGSDFLLEHCSCNIIPKRSNHYKKELDAQKVMVLRKSLRKWLNKRYKPHFNLHEKILTQLTRQNGTIKISSKKAFKGFIDLDINLNQLPKYFLQGKKKNGEVEGALSWINCPKRMKNLTLQIYEEQHGRLVLTETLVLLNLK